MLTGSLSASVAGQLGNITTGAMMPTGSLSASVAGSVRDILHAKCQNRKIPPHVREKPFAYCPESSNFALEIKKQQIINIK